jgi:hypothetical protein
LRRKVASRARVLCSGIPYLQSKREYSFLLRY